MGCPSGTSVEETNEWKKKKKREKEKGTFSLLCSFVGLSSLILVAKPCFVCLIFISPFSSSLYLYLFCCFFFLLIWLLFSDNAV